jgi:hypothetical protein
MKKAKINESHNLSGILALVALAATLTTGGCTPTQSEKASSGNTPFSDPKTFAEEFKTPTPQYPYGLTGVTFFPYAEAVVSE